MRKILIPVLAIFLLSACKKLDQQPISQITSDNFFQTENDFLTAVNGAYAGLQAYPDRQMNLSETRSDNLYAVSDGGVRDWEGVNDFFTTLSTNNYINEAYQANFEGILRANTVLDKLKTNAEYIQTAGMAERFEGEMRFLRAFYYFDLVRYFGGVPIADHVLTPEESFNTPRSSVEAVTNFIIEDLKAAANLLPPSYSSADKGRATSWAAKGMLAKVYMTRSGPTYNVQGPGLGKSEWAQAYALLQEIITTGPYSSVPVDSNIFSYSNENNSEVIFDVQYVAGGLGLGATFPTLLTPDQYFMSFGLPTQGALYIRPVSNSFLNSFDTANDLRYKFGIQKGFTYLGATEARSFYKKYVNITNYKSVSKSRTDWGINFIALRYTEILFLKAECILRGGGGSQADVDEIYNNNRIRAGLTSTATGVTMEQLMEEKRKEFFGEGLRWHDLVRSGLVTTLIPAWITADDAENKIQPFRAQYVIYPLPQTQIDVKVGLYSQNDGY